MEVKTTRDSRIELLRIFAIFVITMYHVCLHTVISDGEQINGLRMNQFIESFLHIGGKYGVNLFITITGYFQITSKFSSKKVVSLEIQVLFYSIGFLLIYLLHSGVRVIVDDPRMLIESTMPIIYGLYWFLTTYFGLYLLSPFINILIRSMNKSGHIILIYILGCMFSVLPTFFISKEWVNNLLWFILIYIIGAYIRLYEDQIKAKISKYQAICFTAICMMLIWGMAISLNILAHITGNNTISAHINFFAFDYSLLQLCLCVSTFLCVLRIKVFKSKLVNRIGKLTLGVYLFQSNPIMSQYYLWPFMRSFNHLFNTYYWILFVIVGTISIFAAGLYIEHVRRLLNVDAIVIKKLNKLFIMIDNYMNHLGINRDE